MSYLVCFYLLWSNTCHRSRCVSSYLFCSGHNWLLCDVLRIWYQAQRDDYQGWCVLYGSVSSVQLLWYHYTNSGNRHGFHAEVDMFACPTSPLELQLFAPTTHFFFVVSPNQQLKRRVHVFLNLYLVIKLCCCTFVGYVPLLRVTIAIWLQH